MSHYESPRQAGSHSMRHDHYKTSDDRYYAAPDQRGGGHGPSSRHQRPALPPEGPVLTAKVKWFNVFKGFGFVECFTEENAYIGDAFLPADALADIGRDAVRKDDQLKLYVRETDKGHKVTHVVSIEEAPASSETSATAASPDLVDLSSGDILEGVVKWYDADIKRYGFIAMDDGGKDVFIHSSVLERSQIYQLVEGQRIRVRVIMGRKGREAILIESLV